MAAGLVIPRGSKLASIPKQILRFDSNATLAKNDLVNVESGQLEVAGAGDFLAGYVMQAATSSSSDVPVDVTPLQLVVMDNDNTGTTFAATHVGNYFDITGGTGVQIVDTSTAGATYTALAGQLICLEYNPQGVRSDLDSDTSVGLFIMNPKERQFI